MIDLAENLAGAIEREDREAMERLMAEGYDSASDELLELLQVRPCMLVEFATPSPNAW